MQLIFAYARLSILIIPEHNIAKQKTKVKGSNNSLESYMPKKSDIFLKIIIFLKLSGVVNTDIKVTNDAIVNDSHNALIIIMNVKKTS